ncbi:hypothetical protein [Microlunatus antarcticus]|uniref:Uncharacterized protein n=1 Tax=Microlunatus antarcticus TaxID=53388 RepID=A0A7W5JYJ7_9ACTN|nr:hypothetical protein [Microlunatus antarcticus]MBB3328707.1 hypothetical protein [Microlunatus antarcticus]
MSQPPQGDQPQQPPHPPQNQPAQGNPPQGQPPQGYPQQGQPQQGYPQQQGGFGPQQGRPGQPPYAGGPGPYPPQPYPPAPYQQGPYQPGPYPQGPPPQGGYPPGGYPPGQGPKKKRTGLFVLIGAGALALILAVVAVAVNLGGRDDVAGGGTTTGGSTAAAPAAATASDAVNGYLQAVAKGDAAAAVAYAYDPSTVDTTALTPEVLAASGKAAPITDIQVGSSDPDSTSVAASYQLGSTPVSTSFDVLKASNDTWKLVTVATDVDLTSMQDSGIPLLMNGSKIKPGPLSLLPGSYRFSSGVRNFDYGSKPVLLVRYPADYPDTSQVQPRISSKGQASAVAAVKKSWNSCLDKKAQKPKGCPNQFVYKDFNFRDSTVRWSRKGSDPFKNLKPTYSDTTTLQYYVKRDLALKGTCTASGRTGTCTGTLKGTAQVEARLKGDKITVDWLQ